MTDQTCDDNMAVLTMFLIMNYLLLSVSVPYTVILHHMHIVFQVSYYLDIEAMYMSLDIHTK